MINRTTPYRQTAGMLRLPLRIQILFAPAVILVLIGGLIWFVLLQLADIKHQNENVRQWVRVCEYSQNAFSIGQRLDNIATELTHASRSNVDDLHFSYLEESRFFSDNLLDPELLDKVSPETRQLFRTSEQTVRYREQLDPVAVHHALGALLPRLKSTYSSLWAQKRSAYTSYYENVNAITTRLVNVSLAILALGVVAGILVSAWTIRQTNGRLGALAQNARAICAGELRTTPAPAVVRDELDELAGCMSRMTQQLIHVVSTEKVLEGAEEERKRIAMDLHDQTLADLTSIKRDVRSLRDTSDIARTALNSRLSELAGALDDMSENIRAVMDDLHPQVIDMLGLESALRSYLDRHLARPGLPAYHLHVEDKADNTLSDLQRLMLYRIAVEAVNNAVRHAQCTRYEVACRLLDDTVVFSVEDNGTGFDPTWRAPDARGLANIEQRASSIGATVDWSHSRFSTGTRLEIRVPAKRTDPDTCNPAIHPYAYQT
jgi:two-component system sensor histidine kinase UhpB